MKNGSIIILLCFIYFISEAQEFIPAQASGGRQQLKYFIEQELIYPETAIKSSSEGEVILFFSTDEKGKVTHTDFKIKLTPECDQETKRIFNMIEWEPASLRGIPVKDSGTFHMEFNIKKYNRLCKYRGYTAHLYPFEPKDTSGTVYQYRNLETAPHPIFTNNLISLAGYVAANLKYPEAAVKQNLSGVVKVGFIVETHGKISNVKIINSLGAGCNEEALRIVRMIKWMPGTVNRMAVRTRMSISINFSLDQNQDGNFTPIIKSSYGE
ncbi:MAG: TonB family protein [Lentimicrobium sp.]|nr:TonB family protein [Lentimicrobium sp.]